MLNPKLKWERNGRAQRKSRELSRKSCLEIPEEKADERPVTANGILLLFAFHFLVLFLFNSFWDLIIFGLSMFFLLYSSFLSFLFEFINSSEDWRINELWIGFLAVKILMIEDLSGKNIFMNLYFYKRKVWKMKNKWMPLFLFCLSVLLFSYRFLILHVYLQVYWNGRL